MMLEAAYLVERPNQPTLGFPRALGPVCRKIFHTPQSRLLINFRGFQYKTFFSKLELMSSLASNPTSRELELNECLGQSTMIQ